MNCCVNPCAQHRHDHLARLSSPLCALALSVAALLPVGAQAAFGLAEVHTLSCAPEPLRAECCVRGPVINMKDLPSATQGAVQYNSNSTGTAANLDMAPPATSGAPRR